MSRLYEALRRLEQGNLPSGAPVPEIADSTVTVNSVIDATLAIGGAQTAEISVSPESRLVALSAPKSLGAEKFRALVTRLEHMRQQRELKSFQVTSSVINEGKSMIAANLALTLASDKQSRVLLVEGDLRRPTLTSLFGLKDIRGLGHWWSGTEGDLAHYLYKFKDMPLWFLGADKVRDQPSAILQSPRFTEAFAGITSNFDWIVVDSTPMLPVVDANLWSRLVDGTLLVVREGVAPVSALKKGLESLDNPKLIGVVLNEASEFNQGSYKYSYYDSQ